MSGKFGSNAIFIPITTKDGESWLNILHVIEFSKGGNSRITTSDGGEIETNMTDREIIKLMKMELK